MSQQSQNGMQGSYRGATGAQIYSASYSGVDVYEMEVNNVAVMRRRNDSWLNATQLLKVAGVDKGPRTKILEKEIQTGQHEKIQGGYGKYQGTWINFERGVEVCRQYGVEELIKPLLTYDMGHDGSAPGQGDFNTPTKEQAMAAQRKRMYRNSQSDGRTNGESGTFFKNISSTASHAVAAISKARFDSPGPRSRNGFGRAPSFNRQSSMQNGEDFPVNSQQSFVSDYGQTADSAYSTQQTGEPGMSQVDEPPRKRARVNMTPADSFGNFGSQNAEMYAQTFPGSPTEPNESFVYGHSAYHDRRDGNEDDGPLAPVAYEMSPDAEQKRHMLMSLFMDSNTTDAEKQDMLRSCTPAELDMPIDAQSHTALHWAATLSRMPLLKALIEAGASTQRVNSSGETALMRACSVTNSMDHGSFPDLLELLGGTIEIRDHRGRTALHHIAVTSAIKGRNAASRYYLESLLEWVVRQGSAPSTQNAQTNGSVASIKAKMGIARFMTEIVNAQDSAGDTALNIAARIGVRSIISQLIEVGADPKIANRVGLRPLDFGIGADEAQTQTNGDMPPPPVAASATAHVPDGAAAAPANETSDDIIASISQLLKDSETSFQAEMKAKQTSIDTVHTQLRQTSGQLGDARRQVEHLTATLKKQSIARQRVSNLSHAREDEQVRLMQEQSRASQPNPSSSWETELSAMLEAADESSAEGMLPSAAILRARIRAIEARRDVTRKMVAALKGRSRDVEVKYRKVVAMCTDTAEEDVDAVIDNLLKAVESEPDGLETSRVRRFLGGVEGTVS